VNVRFFRRYRMSTIKNHTFTARIVSNPRRETCEAPSWGEADKIFKSRLQLGEIIDLMEDNTLSGGQGESGD
jgi:hypothetical protein